MQVGKLARAFCEEKSCWVVGIVSAILPDEKAEIMNPIPIVGSDGTAKVMSPGRYICKDVMQIGDMVRGYCTPDERNGKFRSSGIQGVVTAIHPDGTLEIMTPVSDSGPYFSQWATPVRETFISEATKQWRKRLGI